MFTNILHEEAVRLGLPAVEVDGALAEDDLAKRVTNVPTLSHEGLRPSQRLFGVELRIPFPG